MLNKLVTGRYLDLPYFDNTGPAHPGAGSPTDFVLIPIRMYQIEESETEGVLSKKTISQVSPGFHAKTHRNFRWLPWIPGKVSYVPLAGVDTLTGPFTGCWAVIFKLNGVDYVGHIGTKTSPDTPESISAKNAWDAAVATGAIMPFKAFKPTDIVPTPKPGGKGAATVYAVITPTYEMATVVTKKYTIPYNPKATGAVKQPRGEEIASVTMAMPLVAPIL